MLEISAGITENYFVIVEQPLSVSLWGVLHNQLSNEPMASSLHWYPKHEVFVFILILSLRFVTNWSLFLRGYNLSWDMCENMCDTIDATGTVVPAA